MESSSANKGMPVFWCTQSSQIASSCVQERWWAHQLSQTCSWVAAPVWDAVTAHV